VNKHASETSRGSVPYRPYPIRTVKKLVRIIKKVRIADGLWKFMFCLLLVPAG